MLVVADAKASTPPRALPETADPWRATPRDFYHGLLVLGFLPTRRHRSAMGAVESAQLGKTIGSFLQNVKGFAKGKTDQVSPQLGVVVETATGDGGNSTLLQKLLNKLHIVKFGERRDIGHDVIGAGRFPNLKSCFF